MTAARKRESLTPKESVIMRLLWENGPLFIRQMLELYPEPKPHFNTISTTVRILEIKGYVDHEVFGNAHRFKALAAQEDFRSRSLADVIRNYFNNSYKNAVSALAEEEKISVDDLKEIIELIENRKLQ